MQLLKVLSVMVRLADADWSWYTPPACLEAWHPSKVEPDIATTGALV